MAALHFVCRPSGGAQRGRLGEARAMGSESLDSSLALIPPPLPRITRWCENKAAQI